MYHHFTLIHRGFLLLFQALCKLHTTVCKVSQVFCESDNCFVIKTTKSVIDICGIYITPIGLSVGVSQTYLTTVYSCKFRKFMLYQWGLRNHTLLFRKYHAHFIHKDYYSRLFLFVFVFTSEFQSLMLSSPVDSNTGLGVQKK